MEIIRVREVPKIERKSDLFTGGVVTAQTLLTHQFKNQVKINQVNFSKGARNRFHAHSAEQILIVTAGNGIVATEHEQVNVEMGDIILFKTGEKHWHGATKDSEFSHLVILPVDSKTTILET